MRGMIELGQMALILASGLVTAVILVLPLKLLGNEPQGEFMALAVTVYVVLGIGAVGFVPMWVAGRLRVDR